MHVCVSKRERKRESVAIRFLCNTYIHTYIHSMPLQGND